MILRGAAGAGGSATYEPLTSGRGGDEAPAAFGEKGLDEPTTAAVSFRLIVPKPPTKAASDAGRALVALHFAKLTPQERSRRASVAAKAAWEGLSPAERRKEVKRRIAGKKGKKKKAAHAA